jgi:hypothetical protein
VDELVVGRDAELVHGNHARILPALFEVDSLDVGEAAEDRVGAAGKECWEQVEGNVDLGDVVGGEPDSVEDRVEIVRLVRDSGGRDRLALKVADVRDPGLGKRDQRRERPIDQGRDGDDRQPLILGEEDLGLKGDREVGATGRNLADRG